MTEYDDDFLLKIAKRATRCFDPDDSPVVDPAPYLALALDILGSCAVKMRPDLEITSEIQEFILEEYTAERVLELKAAIIVH